MKLLRLEVEGIRGVLDGVYSFANPRTGAPLDVAVVMGAPRSGKTSLLDAIAAAKEAVGSYGAPIPPRTLRARGAGRARITATWAISEAERSRVGLADVLHTVAWTLDGESLRAEDVDPALRRLFASYSRDLEHGKLEYFPANRGWGARQRSMPVNDAAEARQRAGKDPAKYAHLARALHERSQEESRTAARLLAERGVALRKDVPDSLGHFNEAVAVLLPDLRLLDVELRDGEPVLHLTRRRDRAVLELDELSESEQHLLLFALAFRHFGLNHSLVLIDEPELHIHAAERVRVLQALVSLGFDNQVIVATGAAEIVETATPEQRINLSRARNGA
jgi:hypothetical protein